jgi:hypothetical protein
MFFFVSVPNVYYPSGALNYSMIYPDDSYFSVKENTVGKLGVTSLSCLCFYQLFYSRDSPLSAA